MTPSRNVGRLAFALLLMLTALLVNGQAAAQKVYLNPSNQDSNAVAGGGVESQYALIDANKARDILNAAGFTAKVDQDFTNAPANANSWGAEIFVSIHTNAGGGHGTETLYKTTGGQNLADHIQKGLLSKLPYQDRGLKLRTDLHVLNATNMYACLLEAVFHDCASASGYAGHPPSESAFLKSTEGQDKIAAGIAAGVCTYFGKSCGTSPPQKGTLTGVVYADPDLNNHLAGAKVTVEGGPSATYDGTTPWSFDLDPGTYTVTATLAGYAANSVTRDVVAGQVVWGSIGLKTAEPVVDASMPDATEKDVSSEDVVVAKDAGTKDGGAPNVNWAGSDDSGCSCRLPGDSATPPGMSILILLAGIAMALRRGRRS
ncbi:MAG: N-acetylmuramoyl-L-alanine amidase [Deltaproteobacteria bacterium]|nr:N-acetylmuramoyl-L-alanine amidase [Deltaproteobacteria bacterium]